MIQEQRFIQSDIIGTIYDFPEVGDKIPMHSHDTGTEHLTIFCHGKFRVTMVRGDKSRVTQDYGPGAVVNFAKDLPHEIAALEAPARVFNMMTHMVFTPLIQAYHTRDEKGEVTHHCQTSPYVEEATNGTDQS